MPPEIVCLDLSSSKHALIHPGTCGASNLHVNIDYYLVYNTNNLVFTNITCTTLGVLPIAVMYSNALVGSVVWLSNFTVGDSGCR
jgi:hypothetical protein